MSVKISMVFDERCGKSEAVESAIKNGLVEVVPSEELRGRIEAVNSEISRLRNQMAFEPYAEVSFDIGNQKVSFGNVNNTDSILKVLLSKSKIHDTPKKRHYGEGIKEVLIAVGKDETATLTLHQDAIDYLVKGE